MDPQVSGLVPTLSIRAATETISGKYTMLRRNFSCMSHRNRMDEPGRMRPNLAAAISEVTEGQGHSTKAHQPVSVPLLSSFCLCSWKPASWMPVSTPGPGSSSPPLASSSLEVHSITECVSSM